MFRRRFKDNFKFSEDSVFKQKDTNEFDYFIYVIYDELELLDFLKQNNKDRKSLVCLFNRQYYKSLSFLNEISNLILFDESKTRNEIVKELQYHFDNKFNMNTEKDFSPLLNSNLTQTKFQDYYKAMLYLI